MAEVVLQPTMEHIVRMMRFLRIHNWLIPSHNMETPQLIANCVSLHRTNKVFRIILSDVSKTMRPIMSYYGSCHGMVDIYRYDIPMNQKWLDRAYIYLLEDVKKDVRIKSQRSQMIKVDQLLLRFGGLGFIDLGV